MGPSVVIPMLRAKRADSELRARDSDAQRAASVAGAVRQAVAAVDAKRRSVARTLRAQSAVQLHRRADGGGVHALRCSRCWWRRSASAWSRTGSPKRTNEIGVAAPELARGRRVAGGAKWCAGRGLLAGFVLAQRRRAADSSAFRGLAARPLSSALAAWCCGGGAGDGAPTQTGPHQSRRPCDQVFFTLEVKKALLELRSGSGGDDAAACRRV